MLTGSAFSHLYRQRHIFCGNKANLMGHEGNFPLFFSRVFSPPPSYCCFWFYSRRPRHFHAPRWKCWVSEGGNLHFLSWWCGFSLQKSWLHGSAKDAFINSLLLNLWKDSFFQYQSLGEVREWRGVWRSEGNGRCFRIKAKCKNVLRFVEIGFQRGDGGKEIVSSPERDCFILRNYKPASEKVGPLCKMEI